jgi:hypothetical protein
MLSGLTRSVRPAWLGRFGQFLLKTLGGEGRLDNPFWAKIAQNATTVCFTNSALPVNPENPL